MLYTCDSCHYTFQADALPSHCPDCGKESINRRVGTKVIASPAIREATDQERSWYEANQEELRREEENKVEKINAAECLNEAIKTLDTYGMTDDEFNWSLVLLNEHKSSQTFIPLLDIYITDPDRALDYYRTTRRMFTRKINEERNELKRQGRNEPWSTAMIEEQEYVPRPDLDDYGPTLAVLYRFKGSELPFFDTPNLGNIRRIDLNQIAAEPSTGYLQFLTDWKEACKKVPLEEFHIPLLWLVK